MLSAVARPGIASARVVDLRASRPVENLVLVLFWLLLLEGALRKWAAPQLSPFLFFVRDPFLLLLYWHAFRVNAFRGAGPFLWAGLAFGAAALLLAFVQSLSFNDPRFFTVSVYGWRQYFLYLPLPFAMAGALNKASLQRFIRHALAGAVLTAVVAVVQAGSPPASIINRGIAEEESLQFQSFAFTGGRIRPSGTFTSAAGINHVVPSTLALVLALWLMPARERGVGLPYLLVATAATAACLAVSGSRAAFAHAALVTLTALLVGFVTRAGTVRARALTIPGVLVLCAAALYPVVFPESLELMTTRVREASGTQSAVGSVLGRALGETVDFVRFVDHAPVLGYGLGLGGNGRTYLGNQSGEFLARIAAEADWSRHIVDLGIAFGVLFIAYRILFTLAVAVRAVRAVHRSGNPLPLLLFGYVGLGLFYGQLTGHGTIGGFIWLYLGLCLASCNVALGRRR